MRDQEDARDDDDGDAAEEMVCDQRIVPSRPTREEDEVDDVSAAAYFEMLEAFGYELQVNCGWPAESADAFVAQYSTPTAPQAQGEGADGVAGALRSRNECLCLNKYGKRGRVPETPSVISDDLERSVERPSDGIMAVCSWGQPDGVRVPRSGSATSPHAPTSPAARHACMRGRARGQDWVGGADA